jgi:hypothetical protein
MPSFFSSRTAFAARCRSHGAALLGALMTATSASASTVDRPKIAVFDAELLDFGPGASAADGAAGDAYNLLVATNEAMRLLVESGRYTVVSVGAPYGILNARSALRECGGCEASVAGQFGADQSLLLVVTRISMTDYSMTFTVRDARSGTVISKQTTDLRMGANYSWGRGAAWLVKNKLLQTNTP